MTISVVGLGLVGGSLSLALQKSAFATKYIGVDNREDHVNQALKLGLVQECYSLDEAIQQSDLVLLAIPVIAITKILPHVLDQLHDDQVVIDFGSTKQQICEVVKQHPRRSQFVAAHPMAGTENTGPFAAFPDLFENKINIICEKALSNKKALQMAESLFEILNMKCIYMDADAHDKHVAYVSHLSHVSSFMLGLTVLDIEKNEKNIFNLAGSGFQSTVRLAMSSPEMWAPIFDQNATNISTALEEYINHLKEFKRLIDEHDATGMKESMQRANDIRRILKK